MERYEETIGGARIVRIPAGSLATNCYVIQAGTELMLVDPGMTSNREFEEAATIIESAHARLRWIVATHGHADHVAAVDAMVGRFPDAVFFMEPSEAVLARDPDRSFASEPGMQAAMHAEASPLVEGQTLSVGAVCYRVAIIAGHTPASCVLIAEDHVFTGDALFAGSVGRAPSVADFERLVDGIRRVLMSLPPGTRVFPGHGEPTTIGEELQTNPWL